MVNLVSDRGKKSEVGKGKAGCLKTVWGFVDENFNNSNLVPHSFIFVDYDNLPFFIKVGIFA